MREKVRLTPNFTLDEFVSSEKARELSIDNSPPDTVLNNLAMTAHKMELIRTYLRAAPIEVLSGYRCPQLNKAVGGSSNSQHMAGEACDFVSPEFGTPREIVAYLTPLVQLIGIDQLIFEKTWVHVSFSDKPRFEVLTLLKAGTYARGLV